MEVIEAVMYNDDGLCVRYEDNSILQLSPCATVFKYQDSSSTKPSCIQQLSKYAVSFFRTKVAQAISLRNQFSTSPYLCKQLLDKDEIIFNYKEITECAWPKTAIAEFVVSNRDGSIVVKSLDGYASVTLYLHRQTFTACYLAEVSQDSIHLMPTQKKKQHLYTWVKKAELSIHYGDECWQYPLKMALALSDELQTTEELEKMSNISQLPLALPAVSCFASHLHQWIPKEVFTGKENDEIFWQPYLKIIYKKKIVYRVYKGKPDMLKLDIHPGDGSVISSSGMVGKYFTHYSGRETENIMYSVDNPPPDKPGKTYSVLKVIKQGARLYDFVAQVGLHTASQPSTYCWESKITEQENVPPMTTPLQISETANIPDVGKFVAYSNGHIHVTFTDRTILNVRYPRNSQQEGHWALGLCFNVILPNGHSMQVNGQEKCGLDRYIKLACEWGDWVNSSTKQRESFYNEAFWNLQQKRVVEAEIGKLRRFNYILDHGPLNHGAQTDHKVSIPYQVHVADDCRQEEGLRVQNSSGSASVTTALKKTTDTIKDIEIFLANSKIDNKNI